jgi:hypothetical protein
LALTSYLLAETTPPTTPTPTTTAQWTKNMPVTNSEANQHAKTCSKGGLTRELAIVRDNNATNPAWGESGGYPLYQCIQILE